MTLQEFKDLIEALGEEEIKGIFIPIIEKEMEAGKETLEEFIEDYLQIQKEAIKGFVERSEQTETDCRTILEMIANMQTEIETNLELSQTKLEATVIASEQSQTSAETAQRASETAVKASSTAQTVNENINCMLNQIRKALDESRKMHAEALEIKDRLEQSTALIGVMEEFIDKLPDIEEITGIVDKIDNEILPDLRRTQQSFIDTLNANEVYYNDLKYVIVPKLETLKPQIEDLIAKAEELVGSDFSDLMDTMDTLKNDFTNTIIPRFEELEDNLETIKDEIKTTIIPNAEAKKTELQAVIDSSSEILTDIDDKVTEANTSITTKKEESLVEIDDYIVEYITELETELPVFIEHLVESQLLNIKEPINSGGFIGNMNINGNIATISGMLKLQEMTGDGQTEISVNIPVYCNMFAPLSSMCDQPNYKETRAIFTGNTIIMAPIFSSGTPSNGTVFISGSFVMDEAPESRTLMRTFNSEELESEKDILTEELQNIDQQIKKSNFKKDIQHIFELLNRKREIKERLTVSNES